jgi:hypothetical protein
LLHKNSKNKLNNMKKNAILFFIGAVLSTGAIAQTKDIKHDEKVLKNTVADKKEDRQEAAKDLGHLKVKAALKERKEVRHHRRSIHRQGRHLERHGIKHPIKKARHEVRVDQDAKNK